VSRVRGDSVPRAKRPSRDAVSFDDLPDVAVPTLAVPEVVVAVPEEMDEPVVDSTVAPVVKIRRRGRRSRARVRRVTRVIRHVDSWSVLKISAIFYLTMYFILLVAGVLLWFVAVSTGTVGNVERFIRDLFALDTFHFSGGAIFHDSWIIGAFLVAGGTGLNVTLAVLFNLISDLVGGLRVTVLEEEVVLTNVIDDATSDPGNV
jgi:hypothetical protein